MAIPSSLALANFLKIKGYAFVCPSPETYARVLASAQSKQTKSSDTLEDIFGWNLECTQQDLADLLPSDILDRLKREGIIEQTSKQTFRSTIRVSNFYLPEIVHCSPNLSTNLYYFHSSFPATVESVFFGPDTYLFVSFLRDATWHRKQAPRIQVDVCCGSGAGIIHMARTYPKARSIGLDLNPRALDMGAINSELAGTTVDFRKSDFFSAMSGQNDKGGIDLIVANPPYIASATTGDSLPIYADGGSELGLEFSIRILEDGLKLLETGGLIMIYTGVAIYRDRPGFDMWLHRLQHIAGLDLIEYRILHPDMWPEEIGKGAYKDVGRIQAVGAVLRRTAHSQG